MEIRSSGWDRTPRRSASFLDGVNEAAGWSRRFRTRSCSRRDGTETRRSWSAMSSNDGRCCRRTSGGDAVVGHDDEELGEEVERGDRRSPTMQGLPSRAEAERLIEQLMPIWTRARRWSARSAGLAVDEPAINVLGLSRPRTRRKRAEEGAGVLSRNRPPGVRGCRTGRCCRGVGELEAVDGLDPPQASGPEQFEVGWRRARETGSCGCRSITRPEPRPPEGFVRVLGGQHERLLAKAVPAASWPCERDGRGLAGVCRR